MLATEVINSLWNRICDKDFVYTTPNNNGNSFCVISCDNQGIQISTQGGNGTNVPVTKAAFVNTVEYLLLNKHIGAECACEIRSNNDPQIAGPLCAAARAVNTNNLRCITYVLPILQRHNIVGINSNAPNKTWLIP